MACTSQVAVRGSAAGVPCCSTGGAACRRPALAAAQRLGSSSRVAQLQPQFYAFHAAAATQRRQQGQQQRGRTVSVPAAAASGAPGSGPAPALDSLELLPILTVQGYVQPDVPEGTEAAVFAVYDDAKTLQYVGFSRGLRDSLRTLFSRRPEKAFYYRALYLPQLDQQQMLDIRSAWFDANFGPPPGNKLPRERDQWQQPQDAFAVSERGKAAAAVELAKQLQERIRLRGCKEEFVPSADLLEEGKVDFIAAAALAPEELERQRAAAELAAKSTCVCEFEMDGQPATFDLLFKNTLKTNGGYMFDIIVTFQDKETFHRVIVGRDFYEPQGIEPQATVQRTIAFLLKNKVPRQTEGMLLNSQFSSNYFSISQVEQNFDDFDKEFTCPLPGEDKFWRFNRTQDYGYKGTNETAEQLKANFG